MLVLTRKLGQEIVFPDLGITVRIVDITRGQVRVGVDAPREIQVLRAELLKESNIEVVA